VAIGPWSLAGLAPGEWREVELPPDLPAERRDLATPRPAPRRAQTRTR